MYKNYLLKVLIPFFLLTLWIISSLLFIPSIRFLSLTSDYGKNNFSLLTKEKLLKGKKAVAEFKAKENNLGIIYVRFNTFNKINDDQVIFRLKEKSQKDWYYSNVYNVDQFQPNQFFSFGFPKILNSKNKEYVFEIESLRGKNNNAVAISSLYPIFSIEYQFTKKELLSDKFTLLNFSFKKPLNAFSNINFFIQSLVYLLPLFFYLFWLLKYLNKNNYLPFYFYVFIILIVTFFPSKMGNYSQLLFMAAWIFLIIVYDLGSSISFLLTFLFLITCVPLLLFSDAVLAERASLLAYFFIVIGAFQMVWELKSKKKFINFEEFRKHIFVKKKEIIPTAKKIKNKLFLPVLVFLRFIKWYFKKPNNKKSLIFFLVIILIILFFADSYFYNMLSTRSIDYKKPGKIVIRKVEPYYVRNGDKVILYGNNMFFGSKPILVTSNRGKITSDFWTSEEAYFTIPTNWESGKVNIWLEDYKSASSEAIRSNKMQIRVISRKNTNLFSSFLYVWQIKNLSSEIRGINKLENDKILSWIGSIFSKR